MKKLSKKGVAWLVIAIVAAAGITLNYVKDKNSAKTVPLLRGSVAVMTGADAKKKYYRQRFVAGDEGADDKIAVINIVGELSNSRSGPMYRGGMVDELIDQLRQAEKDDNIKAIILDIDSPGGPIIDADIIYTKIKALSAKKPVIAYLDRVAASGGYYVACGAKKIVSHPLSITGSIGVVMDYMNLQGLLEKKLGIEMGVIKSGRYKDIGSPFRRMGADERKMMQDLVDEAQVRFVSIVSEGRNMPVKKVAELADGRIFSGRQALKAGLVDELGDRDKAVEITKQVAGLKKAEAIEYYATPRFRDLLFGKLSEYTKTKSITQIPEPALKYIWQPGLAQ